MRCSSQRWQHNEGIHLNINNCAIKHELDCFSASVIYHPNCMHWNTIFPCFTSYWNALWNLISRCVATLLFNMFSFSRSSPSLRRLRWCRVNKQLFKWLFRHYSLWWCISMTSSELVTSSCSLKHSKCRWVDQTTWRDHEVSSSTSSWNAWNDESLEFFSNVWTDIKSLN